MDFSSSEREKAIYFGFLGRAGFSTVGFRGTVFAESPWPACREGGSEQFLKKVKKGHFWSTFRTFEKRELRYLMAATKTSWKSDFLLKTEKS